MSRPLGTTGEWTYSEYARLPDDGNRYEVIDGEVQVTPAPTPHHQMIVRRLLVQLAEYFEGRDLAIVLQDVDLLFQTGQFLRPDLLVVASDAKESITDRGVEAPPLLVAEVQSPSSRSIDRVLKPRRYLEFGVPCYWVLDPVDAALWVWDTGTGPEAPRRETGSFNWSPRPGVPALELDIAALLAPI